jgi:hypothetical protein
VIRHEQFLHPVRGASGRRCAVLQPVRRRVAGAGGRAAPADRAATTERSADRCAGADRAATTERSPDRCAGADRAATTERSPGRVAGCGRDRGGTAPSDRCSADAGRSHLEHGRGRRSATGPHGSTCTSHRGDRRGGVGVRSVDSTARRRSERHRDPLRVPDQHRAERPRHPVVGVHPHRRRSSVGGVLRPCACDAGTSCSARQSC